uniref:Uncharacterized protein n=1 Tax=Chenopodium quinoa TaxID=63459 RepID=A0A803N1W1_CHEQI
MKKSASHKSAFNHFHVEPENHENARHTAVPTTVMEDFEEERENAPPVPLFREEREREDYDNGVDAKADDFINRFKKQLQMQRNDSIVRYKEMISRTSAQWVLVRHLEKIGLDFEEVEVEGGVEDEGAEAGGSSFITPKKGRVLVHTVFGVEEEVSPPTLGMVKKELRNGKCCKQQRNAKWTCDCYGRPSRKRKVGPLKEDLMQDEETVVQRKTKKSGCPVE